MNRALALFLCGSSCLIFAANRFPVQQVDGCHVATSESTEGLGWLTALVASTQPGAATMRSDLHITSGAQVTLVTVDSICVAAAKARAQEMQIPYDSAAIYVYKVGNVYVADEHVGTAEDGMDGYRPMHFFDLGYNFIGIAGR